MLVGTVLSEAAIDELPGWAEALSSQRTELLWDVAVVDGTDHPSPLYVRYLVAWSKSRPFGPRHRVRLLRFGLDAEQRVFRTPGAKAAYGRRLLLGKFKSWLSYDLLWSLDVNVHPRSTCLSRLAAAATPIAAARPNVLACGLLRRQVVDVVPFRLTTDDGDAQWARDLTAAGLTPVRLMED